MKYKELLYSQTNIENLWNGWSWRFDNTDHHIYCLNTLQEIAKEAKDDWKFLEIGNRGNYTTSFVLASQLKIQNIQAEIVLLDSFIPLWSFQDASLFENVQQEIEKFKLQNLIVPFRQPWLYGLKILNFLKLNFNYIFVSGYMQHNEIEILAKELFPFLLQGSKLVGWGAINPTVIAFVEDLFRNVETKLDIQDDMWIVYKK